MSAPDTAAFTWDGTLPEMRGEVVNQVDAYIARTREPREHAAWLYGRQSLRRTSKKYYQEVRPLADCTMAVYAVEALLEAGDPVVNEDHERLRALAQLVSDYEDQTYELERGGGVFSNEVTEAVVKTCGRLFYPVSTMRALVPTMGDFNNVRLDLVYCLGVCKAAPVHTDAEIIARLAPFAALHTDGFTPTLLKYNRFEAFDWARQRPGSDYSLQDAIRRGARRVVTAFVDRGWLERGDVPDEYAVEAVEHGQTAMVELLVAGNLVDPTSVWLEQALRARQLDMVEWLLNTYPHEFDDVTWEDLVEDMAYDEACNLNVDYLAWVHARYRPRRLTDDEAVLLFETAIKCYDGTESEARYSFASLEEAVRWLFAHGYGAHCFADAVDWALQCERFSLVEFLWRQPGQNTARAQQRLVDDIVRYKEAYGEAVRWALTSPVRPLAGLNGSGLMEAAVRVYRAPLLVRQLAAAGVRWSRDAFLLASAIGAGRDASPLIQALESIDYEPSPEEWARIAQDPVDCEYLEGCSRYRVPN